MEQIDSMKIIRKNYTGYCQELKGAMDIIVVTYEGEGNIPKFGVWDYFECLKKEYVECRYFKSSGKCSVFEEFLMSLQGTE